ncbi:hypothetical protein StoSoilB19_02290 [Arthrobacter sp. StoSoilB19]|nr:hypothetical protein StoSoilB19_02290 [Arthrobacter sp. StoSoilB19]
MSFFTALLLAVLLKGVFSDPTTVIAGGGRFFLPGFAARFPEPPARDAAKGQPPMTVPFLRPPTYRPAVVYPSIRVKPIRQSPVLPRLALKGAEQR